MSVVFVLKPLYQRALIVFGGPLANFILALVIFFSIYTFVGKDFTPAVINEVQKDSPAMVGGLKQNDIILEIDGNKVQSIMDVSKYITMSTDEIIDFKIKRSYDELILKIKPNLVLGEDNLGNKINKRVVGIKIGAYNNEINHVKLLFRSLEKNLSSKEHEIIVFIDISDLVDDTLCYKLDNGSVKRRSTFKKCFEGDLEFQDSLNEFLKKRLRLTYETKNLLKNKLVEKKIISLKPSLLQTEHERSKWTYKYESVKYNNYSLEEATNIQLENMNKLSSLLKSKNIDLTIAVYPWPGTLKNDVENNKQTILWREFCKNNCKNFYNFMKPFFEISKNKEFYEVYKMFYIENDHHFNELGNKIIADNFLKLYNQK